jgi:predicted phosphodiesterase
VSAASVEVDAMISAGEFLRAYASRDLERMGDLLVGALGSCDREVYLFACALATIADTALHESAKVLDADKSRVRDAVLAMANEYFERKHRS